jgi:hypothetical protein
MKIIRAETAAFELRRRATRHQSECTRVITNPIRSCSTPHSDDVTSVRISARFFVSECRKQQENSSRTDNNLNGCASSTPERRTER